MFPEHGKASKTLRTPRATHRGRPLYFNSPRPANPLADPATRQQTRRPPTPPAVLYSVPGWLDKACPGQVNLPP
ncbi:MAG TPA: hypothetical protein PL117_02615, partial [Accumulibacter sp.]|nr:hypothetical protein [Accumulibacter sp.]